MQPLVSVIIPTFNRAHLLGETLDSILDQTYTHFECLVVDDGSTDHTAELLEFYSEKDSRIKYFFRPYDLPKGANACRNYGFKVSKGDYIQWFDSDDLMTSDSLAIKVYHLDVSEIDYVISKTECFKDPHQSQIISRNEKFYTFKRYPISNYNYVTQRLNWLTYDFMGKRELLNNIEFNEDLSSNQERNFFCKLTCFSNRADVIDKYLTKVRIHSKSIQGELRESSVQYLKESQKFFYLTWLDLKDIGPKESIDFLFFRTLNYSMHFKTNLKLQINITSQILKEGKYMASFYYVSYQLVSFLSGRGHILRKQVLKYFKEC